MGMWRWASKTACKIFQFLFPNRRRRKPRAQLDLSGNHDLMRGVEDGNLTATKVEILLGPAEEVVDDAAKATSVGQGALEVQRRRFEEMSALHDAEMRRQGRARATGSVGLGPVGLGAQGGGTGRPPALHGYDAEAIAAMHFRVFELLREDVPLEEARRRVYPAELLEHPATQITAEQAKTVQQMQADGEYDARILEAPLHPEDQAVHDYFKRLEDAGVDTMAGQRIWTPGAAKPTVRPIKPLTADQVAAKAQADAQFRRDLEAIECDRATDQAERAERDRRRIEGTAVEHEVEQRRRRERGG